MSKNRGLNKLFNNWEKRYRPEENFTRDGIINEEFFATASSKVLFVAKEPNDPNQEGVDFRKWWNEEIMYSFSYRIAEWAYGILSDFPPYDEIWKKKDDSKAHNALKSIAFMNVKKSGGKGTSHQAEIEKYIERDLDLIYRQIEIIDPEIIIIGMSWGRTVNLLFPDVKWRNSGYSIEIGQFNKAKVIDFYHPSARNGPAAVYCLLEKLMGTKQFANL